jgi:hypothetical protein
VDDPVRYEAAVATHAQLAGKIDPFELAKIMGTSTDMIEHHYGALLSGAAASIASRLAAFEADQRRARNRATDEGR